MTEQCSPETVTALNRNDIVYRLRHPVGTVTVRIIDLYNEAANEIERLRGNAQSPLPAEALESFQKIQAICDSYPMTVYSICSEMIDKLSPVTSTDRGGK